MIAQLGTEREQRRTTKKTAKFGWRAVDRPAAVWPYKSAA